MDLLVFIILALISLIPSILLYKWLSKKNGDENKEVSKKALIAGISAILPILLASAILFIIGRVSRLEDINPLLYQAYYTFIVLAFAEELVKFLTFKRLLKKNPQKYSWFNLVIFMTIVGIGFGIIENVTLAIGSNIIVMSIRAISIGHGGYGFIMGWLYGKMLKTGKKIYGVLSFIVPWLLHGLYDFGLSEELIKINDNFAFISILLELVCIIFVFIIIRFVRKRNKFKIYTEPIANI